ncbi:uncharacterized protein PV09_02387 [Verruconis gallopava]|uniref:Heterokaryon incompatibility domain-containing protein n=1 Tax=Verruconis gallopava TaxID=253628 RepID=A0A0D1Z142_9PEZI|nr:uncharacterized protein PV09_02387 [Verruconis gallopava]KIW06682.1 hypothetical protein PV09_02387 [Verruconis gallopava]
MAQIYTNCYINISADASQNGAGGLFRDRDAAAYHHFRMRGPERTGYQEYLCFSPSWLDEVELAPLKKRAWVVQERFLAPRVIHFSESQVHWECAELITSESVPDNLYISPRTTLTFRKSPACKSIGGQPADIIGRFRLWTRLVGSYSRAMLTFVTDRPVAIAGLARAVCHLTNLGPHEYVCGHWRPHFIPDIMWFTKTSLRRLKNNFPSWSWLSVDGDFTNLCFWNYGEGKWASLAELERVDVIQDARNDGFVSIESASANIWASLCRGILSTSKYIARPSDTGQFDSLLVLSIGQHVLRCGNQVVMTFDDGGSGISANMTKREIYLLLAGHDVRQTEARDQKSTTINISLSTSNKPATQSFKNIQLSAGTNVHCLIITPTGKTGTFQRIGFLEFVGEACPPNLLEVFCGTNIDAELYEDLDDRERYLFTLV